MSDDNDRGGLILAALDELDPHSSTDWTEDGLPSLDRIGELTGLDDVDRSEVTDVAPDSTRDALLGDEPDVPDAEPTPDELNLSEASSVDVEIALVDEAVNKLDQAIDRLNTERATALAKRRALSNRKAAGVTNRTYMEEKMAAMKAEQASREARARRSDLLVKRGLLPEDLDGRSPLDIKMAQKRATSVQPLPKASGA
jgi:hypothetical protein